MAPTGQFLFNSAVLVTAEHGGLNPVGKYPQKLPWLSYCCIPLP